MKKEIKELINTLIEYSYLDELKDFNEQYNDTNYYWSSKEEIETAIKENYEDCHNHIFVTLFELQYYIEKGE